MQQLDLAVPQQESNRPACATLPNPRVATTAVKDLIQYIKQRLLPLGLVVRHGPPMVPGGEQAVFSDTEEKPETARDARRDLSQADSNSHRPGRGDKVQNAPQTLSPSSSDRRGHAEAFAGRRLTIGDGRSSALNRQHRNGPLNFSSLQTAKDLRRNHVGSQRSFRLAKLHATLTAFRTNQ